MNAMTDVLCGEVVLHDGAGAFEKYCITYLILTERVPPPKGTNCTKTIAEWLTVLDFRANILSQKDGFVLEIARDEIRKSIVSSPAAKGGKAEVGASISTLSFLSFPVLSRRRAPRS